jgi:hypothetical protein
MCFLLVDIRVEVIFQPETSGTTSFLNPRNGGLFCFWLSHFNVWQRQARFGG